MRPGKSLLRGFESRRPHHPKFVEWAISGLLLSNEYLPASFLPYFGPAINSAQESCERIYVLKSKIGAVTK